ncbi:MAG: ankyrin repeat domain-containing protein [Bacillota bacterium]|nr:ankyrin repeat domain-containing protein [Bacillota bacterium]
MKKMFMVLCVAMALLTACSVQNDLISAIKNGDEKAVVTAIEKNADVNLADTDGNVPIIIAVEKGNVELVKLLLKNGANPNVLSANGRELIGICFDKFSTNDIFELIKLGIKKDEAELVKLAEQSKRYDFLTKYYADANNFENIIKYADLALEQNKDDYLSLCLSADAYVVRAKNTEDLQQKINYSKKALDIYNSAIAINENAPISSKEVAQVILTSSQKEIENIRLAEEAKKAEEIRKTAETKQPQVASTQPNKVTPPPKASQPTITQTEPKVEKTWTYTRWAEQGAVITKNDPKSAVFSYKKKCDACGNVENGSTTTGSSGVNSSFTCTKCKNKQKIVIKSKVTSD